MKKYTKPTIIAKGIGNKNAISKGCPKAMEAFCGVLYRA